MNVGIVSLLMGRCFGFSDEEMQDLAHQMTELAARAQESNADFVSHAGELSPRIAEVTADIVAHDLRVFGAEHVPLGGGAQRTH